MAFLAALPYVIGAAGALGAASISAAGGREANQMNANLNEENRDFNREQSEVAYNRNLGLMGREMDYNAQQAGITRDFNSFEAEKARQFQSVEAGYARDFNSAQAIADRDWQERMSNTQYQRSVADMQKAGINPMLAIMKGGAGVPSGASASSPMPSGSSASGPTASIGGRSVSPAAPAQPIRMEDALSPAVNTGFRAAEAVQTIRNLKAQNSKIEAETELIRSQTNESAASAGKLVQDTKNAEVVFQKLQEEVSKTIAERQESYARQMLINTQEGLTNAQKKLAEGQMTTQYFEQIVKEAEGVLLRNEIPRSRNEAEAQRSWWMREISPFLPDFLKGATGAGVLSRGLK